VHGTVIAADEQTAGIGRRGRPWAAKNEGNIYMTFVWHVPVARNMQERVRTMTQLNFACGIAVVKAAKALGVDAQCKWPNDVWVNGKKLSGALVDFDGKNTGVAGIGVNVNQSAASLAEVVKSGAAATSVAVETGKEQSREDFMAAICNDLERLMAGDMSSTMAEYATHDMLNGRVVRVCHNSREVSNAPPSIPAPNASPHYHHASVRVPATGGRGHSLVSRTDLLSPSVQVASDADYDAIVIGFYPNGNLKVSKVGDPASEIALSGEEISIRQK
jgi:biotin-[acetyl-CoA-carboxylase] ligase BirA-like protein